MKHKNGFTFVELMVVVALFGVVSVVLFSSFSMGLRVWKRATSFNLAERKAIITLERMAAELRQTVNYPLIGFKGEKDQMIFAAVFQNKIYNISYVYSAQEKSVNRLALSRQQMLGLEELGKARSVIPNAQEFVLSFYGQDPKTGQLNFLDHWNYALWGIPAAVKVSITLEDEKKIEKIISIPISS